MDLIGIGKRIRMQREYLGMTRESLAEKLDITPKFCSDIELGIKGMSVNTLCNIADVLSLSTDYILFGVNKDSLDNTISALLRKCPSSKLCHLEKIIKAYISAIDGCDK
ncbi:MAG: helix-turn-helix transcriptional regulator [Clostridia bacterium]|nr:helix-turn-helix transcriptional regulator [Clostridia bacterium]